MNSTNIGIIIAVLIIGGGVTYTMITRPAKSEVKGVFTEADAKLEIKDTATTTDNTTNMAQTAPTTPVEPLTDLKMKDEVVGTGAEAKKGDSVTVQYVGALTNGKIFDASKNHGDAGFTFNLGGGQVIKGWDMGVEGMKVGGKRMLAIPAALAYGAQEVGGGLIPANSDLIFEVELIKVGK